MAVGFCTRGCCTRVWICAHACARKGCVGMHRDVLHVGVQLCTRICTRVSVQNIAQRGCTHLLMGVAKAEFAHECAREVAHGCMSNV